MCTEAIDTLPAHPGRGSGPEAAHRWRGPPGGSVSSRPARQDLLPRLPAQDDLSLPQLEQAVVRVRPLEADTHLLQRPQREETPRWSLLSGTYAGSADYPIIPLNPSWVSHVYIRRFLYCMRTGCRYIA